MLERARDVIFSLLIRHRLPMAATAATTALGLGVTLGIGVELAFVLGFVGWTLWERRARFYLACGLLDPASRVSAELARGAGHSMRRDYHLLTLAAARMSRGDLAGSKQVLTALDPTEAPPDERFCQFLNMGELFRRLGDLETAQAMAEAAAAGARDVPRRWRAFSKVVEARVLAQRGEFDAAAALLTAVRPELRPLGSWSGTFHSTLALALALGSGCKQRALDHARRAVAVRGWDPHSSGALGVAALLAGEDPELALPHLERTLEQLDACGPLTRAAVEAAAVRGYRLTGRVQAARLLEQGLGSSSAPGSLGDRVRAAIDRAEPVPRLPDS